MNDDHCRGKLVKHHNATSFLYQSLRCYFAFAVIALIGGVAAVAADPVAKPNLADDAAKKQIAELEVENARLKKENKELRQLVANGIVIAGDGGAKPDAVQFTTLAAIVGSVPEAILPEKLKRNNPLNYSDVHKDGLRDHFEVLEKKSPPVKLRLKVRSLPEKSVVRKKTGYVLECEAPEGRVIGSDQEAYLQHAGMLWHLRTTVFFPKGHEEQLIGLKAGDIITVAGSITKVGYPFGDAGLEDSPIKHHEIDMMIEVPPKAE
jgi:hypothetical protein